jgi:hypothetical protein
MSAEVMGAAEARPRLEITASPAVIPRNGQALS